MRSTVEVGDRVRTNDDQRLGTVEAIECAIRFDDQHDELVPFPATDIHRVVGIDSVAAEAIELSKIAGEAIARATVVLDAVDREERRDGLFDELLGIAVKMAALAGMVPTSLAEPITAFAQQLAHIVEREASK